MHRHASGSYLGSFFRVVGPLQLRLKIIGGKIDRSVAGIIVDPSTIGASQPWTRFVCEAHAEARRLEAAFTLVEHNTANLMAP